MTDPKPQGPEKLAARFEATWGNRPGWGVLASVNHTTLGLRFIITGIGFFLVGGVLAMLMRTQLALPGQDLIAPDLYNQLFTMHGTVMMFLFAIPVLEGVAIYLLPKMLGARDMVYPRLTAFGYYCYLFGGLILLSSLFLGVAPDSGWFMYTPLSGAIHAPGPGSDFWLLGITFVEISAMAAGVELVVSILRARAPGMSLRNMPLFGWYILGMALMIVFGFPPLILASILLELERAAGWVFFDIEGGGDPLLWQHLFWLFGHPEVYIIFLPAAGIVSTLIPVFSGRPIVGHRWVVLSIILIGFISFGLWVHHMFTVGIPHLAQAFFSVASMLVAVPTAIQVFAWLATLWTGKVRNSLPMLWLFGFLVIFVAGGLTGVMLALVPFNWQVHDTHFVVAHLHYVLVGGMLFPLIAGFYYWLPHVSGRMPTASLGRWAFWMTFAGFHMSFLMMHLTGLLGMPRRVYTYEAGLGWDGLNLLSSVGGFVMALGIGMIILDVVLHWRFGRAAPRNPWRADTLEWATSTPPAMHNFSSLPQVRDRHPLWSDPELGERLAEGQGGLSEIGHRRRETWGTDAIGGRVREIIHLPSNTWLPLIGAAILAVVCIALLARSYGVALVAAVAAAVVLLRWSWLNGGHPDVAPLRDDDPSDPPLHSRCFDGPGRWGMVVTMMANGTLYASLLFGWFYLWTVSPTWRVPEQMPLSPWPLLLAGGLLSLGAWWHRRVLTTLRAGLGPDFDPKLVAMLWQAALPALAYVAIIATVLVRAPLAPDAYAHDAVLSFALFYLLLHGGLAAVLTLLQAWRAKRGWVGRRLPYEVAVLRPFWSYAVGVHWIGLAAFVLLPASWGGL